MKIAYRFGHLKTCDQGANGIVSEYDFVRQYGAKVVEYLKADGHTLIDCTPLEIVGSMSASLSYGVTVANSNNADLFISFHANAFNSGANGSEVVCGSQKGIEIGTRIVNNLQQLGFANRKAYIDVRGLYEIKATKMLSCIIEPLFVDSKLDMDLFNKVGLDKFSKAIADGIVGHTINGSQPSPTPTPQPIVKKIFTPVELVINQTLNCWDEAGNILKQFKQGDFITAIGSLPPRTEGESGWWKLNINGITGWVLSAPTSYRNK